MYVIMELLPVPLHVSDVLLWTLCQESGGNDDWIPGIGAPPSGAGKNCHWRPTFSQTEKVMHRLLNVFTLQNNQYV